MAIAEDQGTDVSSSDVQDALRTWVPEPLAPEVELSHVDSYSRLGDLAERFVYRTYRERGYCGTSPREWVEEIEQWREGSVLHVISEGDDVLGVIRTVVGEFDELPVSQFRLTAELPPGTKLLDGGSLAVKADHRGFGVATELYRQWVQFGIRRSVAGFAMMMDDAMVHIMQRYYALPVHELAQRRHYMGGDIQPLVVWHDEMMTALARERPALYQYAIEGFSAQEIVDFDLPIVLE